MATRASLRPEVGGGSTLAGNFAVERSHEASRDFGRVLGIMLMRLNGIEGIMAEETRLVREARTMMEARMVAESYFFIG